MNLLGEGREQRGLQRNGLIPPAQVTAAIFEILDYIRDVGFLRLEDGFDGGELGFEFDVFGGFDDLRRVANDGAEEFFFGYLLEVGEAEFGEEFFVVA